MPGALYDENNVVVGHAVLRLAPWVKASLAPLAPDSTPLFDERTTGTNLWATQWKSAGATHEGFKVVVDVSTTTVTIEEQSTPVDEQVEGKSMGIEAALAEDTMESMQLSWGGGTILTTAAGTGITPKRTMSLTDTIAYYTAALETRNAAGYARRIYIPKVSIVGSGDTNFRRAADKRTYPIRLNSLCKPTDIQIVDVTGVAT